MVRLFKCLTAGAILLAAAGFTGAALADSSRMPEEGAFDALSPANKKIAEALFNGQVVTPNGKAPLSLDLIAASKQRDGWGRIFRQLKADGLIDAKNLKELTSGRWQESARARAARSRRPASSTVVTTAGGRQIIIDKNRGKGGKNPKFSDELFSNGSTYRGRLDYAGDSPTASSLGIATAKGVGTSSYIAGQPPRSK